MAHECDGELVCRDARAVITYPDRRPSRAAHVDVDAPSLRVEGVLDQLFNHRGGQLDHLTGRDGVSDLRSEQVNGFAQGDSLARSSYSFCSASSGLSESGSISFSSLRKGSGASSIGSPSCSSGGSSGRCRSRSPSTCRARAMTPDGSPARAATWMP